MQAGKLLVESNREVVWVGVPLEVEKILDLIFFRRLEVRLRRLYEIPGEVAGIVAKGLSPFLLSLSFCRIFKPQMRDPVPKLVQQRCAFLVALNHRQEDWVSSNVVVDVSHRSWRQTLASADIKHLFQFIVIVVAGQVKNSRLRKNTFRIS